MDMRRMLPILLLVFVALFILPQLFKGSGSKGVSTKERGQLTLDAIARIDRAQQKAMSAGGKYSANLAQLVAGDKVLAAELTIPLIVDLDVSEDGKAYVARVTSDIVSVNVNRSGSNVVRGCRILKSRTGVDCPVGTIGPDTEKVTQTTGTATTTRTVGTVTTVTTD
jgi:hypothetical protein